jgi:SAM-dependent methyltransferase
MDAFDRIAPFYDLDYAGVTDDLLFYRELVRATGGPVLEAGCGTGRVLAALADAGVPLLGIDRSEAMLARARARLGNAAHVRTCRADLARLDLDERFAFAFCTADTFLLLDDRDRQRAALARLHDHLRPAGLLALDVFNPFAGDHLTAGGELVLDWVREDPERGTVTKTVARRTDFAAQRQSVTVFYDTVDREGLLRRVVATFGFRFIFRDELCLMLEAAGLRVEQVFGDYDLRGFDGASERMIFLARKD